MTIVFTMPWTSATQDKPEQQAIYVPPQTAIEPDEVVKVVFL